ncbi:MAG: hypothetical protein ACRD0K_10105 [Egibacteraceae bacterium]
MGVSRATHAVLVALARANGWTLGGAIDTAVRDYWQRQQANRVEYLARELASVVGRKVEEIFHTPLLERLRQPERETDARG